MRFTVALVQLDGSVVEGMLSDCRLWPFYSSFIGPDNEG